MDDLMLNRGDGHKPAATSLFSLKGKDWSSLQNLDTESSSEESQAELSPPLQNGYLDSGLDSRLDTMLTHEPMVVVNGEYPGDKYATVHSSDESSQPLSSGHSQPDRHFRCDTTKLKNEDKKMYGLRPANDPFLLAICEHCKGVYKPQALCKHIKLRHSANAEQRNEHTPSIHHDSTALAIKQERASEESCSLTGDGFSGSNQQNNHNLRSLLASTTSKDDLDLERLKHRQTGLSSGKLKSSFRALDSKSNSSNNSTASSSPLATLSDSNSLVKRPNAVKPKLLPCKDRKYDPDKHCGVRLSDDAQPCTRSLTCKTHSLTLRRSVPGRRDSFDRLLNEHRTAKEAALRAAGVEVKPTKLQLKQQARLQKSGQLKPDQPPALHQTPPKELGIVALKDNQSIINKSSTATLVQSGKPTGGPSIQLKIHLQSPNSLSCPSGSPFKSFNQLHQSESGGGGGGGHTLAISSSTNNSSTALHSPTNSFVNINSLQFTSPSPTIKQFTFGNLSASSSNHQRVQPNNYQQPVSLLPSSIQVINTTNSMANSSYQHNNNGNNCSLPASSSASNFLICDLNPATISHYPKPAAVCTFNERRLSIYTQSSNKKILSSKLFNRKQDCAYSALSILCNKEQQRPAVEHLTPVKTNRLHSALSNSQSNSRTDFSSNSNSQDSYANSFQGGRSLLKGSLLFERNGLSPSQKEDRPTKNYLFSKSDS